MNELDWIKYRSPLLRSAWLPANEILQAGEFEISKLLINFGTEINKTSLNKMADSSTKCNALE
jgi:hypothetical protein